jgi:hypothetical protein
VLEKCEKDLVDQLGGELVDENILHKIEKIMQPFTDKVLSFVVAPTVKVEQVSAHEARITFPKEADMSGMFDGGKDGVRDQE